MKKYLQTYKSLPLPVKASFWFLVCSILQKGISFISIPLFARLLAGSEYGKLSLYMSYQLIIVTLATWEIHNGAYLKGLYLYKNDVKFFTTTSQLFIWLLTAITFSGLFIFEDFVLGFTGYTKITLLLLFIYLLSVPGYSFWISRKRNQFEYQPVIIVSLISSILVVIFPLIGILFIESSASIKYNLSLIAESVIGMVFIGSYFDFSFLKNWEKTKEIWKYLINFQAPLIPHAFSFYILNQSDRVMIGKMVSDEKTAIYSVAYSLTMSVIILQASINQTLLPWVYQKLELKKYHKISEISEKVLLLLGIVIICFTLLAPDFLRLLFSETYYHAIQCIPPISASVFFIELYTLYTYIISYSEKTRYITYASLICSVLNIILNYIGIYRWGYAACAYTTMICYILLAFFCYIFSKKICADQEVSINDIYNTKRIFWLSSLMIIVTLMVIFVIDYILVRYMVLLIMIVIGIVKVKEFISSLEKR